MVFVDDVGLAYADPSDVYHDLPLGYGSSNGIDTTMSDGGVSGFRDKFRARRLGVYLLTVTWLFRDSDHIKTTSNPVVLVVSPRFGIDGQAIVPKEVRSGVAVDDQEWFDTARAHEAEGWKKTWKSSR